MADLPTPRLLWSPRDPQSTPISRYRQHINAKFGQHLLTSHDLHKWTVTHPHEFWIDLYHYCNIVPPLPSATSRAYDDQLRMRDIPKFFEGHTLNYAENVLVPNTAQEPDAIALVGLRESQLDSSETVSWKELCELVRMTRSALTRHGLKQGDVVAALMSNSIWVIVIFLATTAMGAIFTSISPDMGIGGCVSRLAQVEPSILFADTDMALRGKRIPLAEKVREILLALSSQASPKAEEKKTKATGTQLVFVPTSYKAHEQTNLPRGSDRGILLSSFLSKSSASDPLSYARVSFSHPMVIVYSSGTTGPPKCIISAHGSIIQYKKIGYLHNSLSSADTVFQYSSTSWILFNIMNGHLSVGAKLVCFDGGALYPDPGELLRICEKVRATYWGTSPRYLLELEMSGIQPRDFDLGKLRMVTTTGSTLTGDQMKWFYEVFPPNVHLSSVAGGTDIATSWVASDPAGPLHANEMQMWALGMDCDIADPETGESIRDTGQPGELICRKPFPSMPVGFWGDEGNVRYRESYFERFGDDVDCWTQHDFTQCNPHTGGIQIHGRSDGVLNPSGIRFGSAEIYAIVEGPAFNDVIADSLCVGRRRELDPDEAVFLFVKMKEGHEFTSELVFQVRDRIRAGLSPRHVPKFVFAIDEIPYTINGKKVEIAVKKIISGLDVKVSSTVANPESLNKYRRFMAMEQARKSKL